MEIYVLDKNLNTVGLVDEYKSLIWSNRYNQVGDCELYLPATTELLNMLQMGYYLRRNDDDMVCQIRKIELDTSAEDGNYIVVDGIDVKAFLDQRIIWGTVQCNGNVETFVRAMVNDTLINPTLTSRTLLKDNGSPLLSLGASAGLTEKCTEQISYVNVGEKVREYCQTYNWGYRIVYNAGVFEFELYSGVDRSGSVVFADEYENLSSTAYIEDDTSLGNVALVAGEGAGADRSRSTYGYGEGVDRYEIFVDARDVSRSLSYAELTAAYPTGTVSGKEYVLAQLDILIIDGNQKAWLEANYTGTIVTIGGEDYYRIANVTIADLAEASPTDDTAAQLRDIIYSGYLLNMGAAAVASFGSKTSFEGSVIPDITFVYKRDYFIGDVVSVKNEYGISSEARIIEVVEVEDDNGYSIEPHFEYKQTAGAVIDIPAGQAQEYEQGAQTITEAAVSAGYITRLGNVSVTFSNGLWFFRSRVPAASLQSMSGVQIGSSGIYEYKIKLNVTGTLSTATDRPVVTVSLYSNNLATQIPASARMDGTAGAWTSMYIIFHYPAASLSGTFSCEYIGSMTI